MTKDLPRGKRGHGRVPSVLIVAGGCGLVVVALSAPVARAQLILSAIAVIAVWFSPPDKSGRSLTKPASCSRCARTSAAAGAAEFIGLRTAPRAASPHGPVLCPLGGAESSGVVAVVVVALCTRMRPSARRASCSSMADTRSSCSR
jgi:hypothetical protein